VLAGEICSVGVDPMCPVQPGCPHLP
jgi:hypothetical protein